MFGCAYHRIADEGCSATTLRERRDEWIELGVIDTLREAVLEAYDRFIGLDLSEVVIIVRRLIREGWIRYRWEGRPSRRS